MKKLLVLVVTVAMLLSIAAVSLGAVTTSASFRFELIDDASVKTSQGKTVDNADFRVTFAGKISDTVDASYTARVQTTGKPGNTVTVSGTSGKTDDSLYADEYFFNFKQSWGTVKVGAFDYKVHPSRILAKAANNNIYVERNPTMTTVNIPIGDSGFYTGGAYVIDGSSSALRDNAYNVKLGYAVGKKYGVELNYYETGVQKVKTTAAGKSPLESALNWDAFYQATDKIKVYVYGTDPKYYNPTNFVGGEAYEQETLLGVLFTKIADTNLQASFEYSIDKRKASGVEWDENPYGIQAIYKFNNGLRLEYELTNVNAKNDAKNLLRFRLDF